MATHESRALLPTITVRAFIRFRTNMPSADFCCEIKAPCGALSHDSATRSRSPEVSSTAFRTQPPNLQPVPLMNMGFVVIGQLARHRMPQIRFLYIGSCVCSTLPPDPASRRRPCASLLLHLHQVVERTFTPELSNMLGTPMKTRRVWTSPGREGTAVRLLLAELYSDGTMKLATNALRLSGLLQVSPRPWPL